MSLVTVIFITIVDSSLRVHIALEREAFDDKLFTYVQFSSIERPVSFLNLGTVKISEKDIFVGWKAPERAFCFLFKISSQKCNIVIMKGVEVEMFSLNSFPSDRKSVASRKTLGGYHLSKGEDQNLLLSLRNAPPIILYLLKSSDAKSIDVVKDFLFDGDLAIEEKEDIVIYSAT
ncbi:hypothetical protein HDU97_009510 [Phlyctochytrium planicorne]|nr:hypothetical protein HDU97_009510 [Phlyctochytrium planicorne]